MPERPSLSPSEKILKVVNARCPQTYRAFFGKKYLLPNARQGEYPNPTDLSYHEFDRVLSFPTDPNPGDDVKRNAVVTVCAALHYDRPTLFLERELGEALLRTELLGDIETADIRWRWPAFQVILPKGLISVQRETGVCSLTHFNVCRIEPDHPLRCPMPYAREMDRLIAELEPTPIRLEVLDFFYKESGMCISSSLDRAETADVDFTIYGIVKPWGSLRLSDYQAVAGDLATPFPQDDTDRALLKRLEHLVLNTLLFLSATPTEYQPQRVVRKPRQEGNRTVPGLVEARFVGEVRLRPTTVTKERSEPTGRKVPAHWVSGYWKKTPYGPKLSLRRLQWIQPYKTHGSNM